MNAQEIVERIMTHHWDLTACRCWICDAGRALGYRPQDIYLHHRSEVKVAHVPSPDGPNPFRTAANP